jgi:hypothetical protein
MSVHFKSLTFPTIGQHINTPKCAALDKTRCIGLGILGICVLGTTLASYRLFKEPKISKAETIVDGIAIVMGSLISLMSSFVLCSSNGTYSLSTDSPINEINPMAKFGITRRESECFMLSVLQIWTVVPELRDSVLSLPKEVLTPAQILFQNWVRAICRHREIMTFSPFKTNIELIKDLRSLASDRSIAEGGHGETSEFQRMVLPPFSPLSGVKEVGSLGSLESISGSDLGIIETKIAFEDTTIQQHLNEAHTWTTLSRPESKIEISYDLLPQILCLEMHPLESTGAIYITPIVLNHTTYEPIGATCHNLKRAGAHCFSCVQNEDKEWLLCNDDRVEIISESEAMRILSTYGTLLYYRSTLPCV